MTRLSNSPRSGIDHGEERDPVFSFDKDKTQYVIIRDHCYLSRVSDHTIIVGEKVHDLKLVRDRIIRGLGICGFLVGGRECIGLNCGSFTLGSSREFRFAVIEGLT